LPSYRLDRKSYMSFRLVSKFVTLNGEMALILRCFIEFGSFRAHCVKVVENATTMDNLRLRSKRSAKGPRDAHGINI